MASSTDRIIKRGGPLRPEHLRRSLLAVGILVIVANAATDAYDQWRSYRFTISNASRELVNSARILSAQTEGTLKAVDVLLRDAAASYQPGTPGQGGDINAALAGRAEGLPQLLSLTISDAQGVQRYRSRPFDDDSRPVVDDRSYFIAQRDNPRLGLFVSEPIVTRTFHRMGIVLSRRLNDQSGQFAGVVSGIIDLDKFQQFYHQINLGPHSSILLFKDDGTLIVREPPTPDNVGKTFSQLPALLASEDGTLMVSPIDGVTRCAAAAHADGLPLIVAVAR